MVERCLPFILPIYFTPRLLFIDSKDIVVILFGLGSAHRSADSRSRIFVWQSRSANYGSGFCRAGTGVRYRERSERTLNFPLFTLTITFCGHLVAALA